MPPRLGPDGKRKEVGLGHPYALGVFCDSPRVLPRSGFFIGLSQRPNRRMVYSFPLFHPDFIQESPSVVV